VSRHHSSRPFLFRAGVINCFITSRRGRGHGGLTVGGDHLLLRRPRLPRPRHAAALIGGEQGMDAVMLLVGSRPCAGLQDGAGGIARIVLAASAPGRVLLAPGRFRSARHRPSGPREGSITATQSGSSSAVAGLNPVKPVDLDHLKPGPPG
jgi:hypothetical protein